MGSAVGEQGDYAIWKPEGVEVFEQRVPSDRSSRMVMVNRVREIRVHPAFSNVTLVKFGVVISAHVVSSSDPTQLGWRASGLWDSWP